MRTTKNLFAGLCISSLGALANAQTYVVTLEGAQAGTASAANGGGTVMITPATNSAMYLLNIAGLTGTETAADVHGPAPPGVSGAVIASLPLGPAKSGTFTFLPALLPDLLAGNFYVDIHTTAFPAGEVRGQIVNPPVAYCFCTTNFGCGGSSTTGGCLNPSGQGAALSATGLASVTVDTLTLLAGPTESNVAGLFYMGTGQTQVVLQGGYRCVSGAAYRYPISSSDGAGFRTLGPGIVNQTVQSFPPAGQITAGSTWNFQLWYRQIVSFPPCGSNLTNGLSVTFLP